MRLEESGPKKQSELVEELGLEDYAMSRLLAKLELHRLRASGRIILAALGAAAPTLGLIQLDGAGVGVVNLVVGGLLYSVQSEAGLEAVSWS